jgi:DNA polymerase-1
MDYEMKKLTVIDTFAFFFRAYYALPPLKSRDGFPTGLLTGFINFIRQLQNSHSTDYILFALDSKESFRREIYKEYKANRDSPPEDLTMQLEVAISWIKKMGFATLHKVGYEADDVIATVTELAKIKGVSSQIVSSDKDLYQLLDNQKVTLYDWVKKVEIKEEDCVKKFGVEPKFFVDFQALVGDSSDNVPGVKGIGLKSASKLIGEFQTLENIYSNLDKIESKRVRNLLINGKDMAFLSRNLVMLERDIFNDIDIESFKFEDKNYLEALRDEFIKYDMRNALKYLQPQPVKDSVKDTTKERDSSIEFETKILNSWEMVAEVLSKVNRDTLISFDTETDSLNPREAKLVGFSFAFEDKKSYYIPVAHNYLGVTKQLSLEDAKRAIEIILTAKVIGQNLKFDFALLKNLFNFTPKAPYSDTMILAWLLDAGSRVGLDTLASRFLNYEMISYKDIVKRGENFSSVDIEKASIYASEDAYITFVLYKKLLETFRERELNELLDEAESVEFPFIPLLIDMEDIGIEVDIEYLKSFREELNREVKEIESSIFNLAGGEFNIKSTNQLSDILFNKLGLKGTKKTKKGFSTNEKVLKGLIGKHPIIPKILEYRERQKILSTYIEPLIKFAKLDKNSRVHTTFLQTGTATGRLSSKEPNLQNIPVRTPLGRRVRKAFIAKDGYKLVSIDYSQIELRLLAHFSKDKALIEAFESGKDIHLETAIRLFGEDKAKEKREFAKSINFGILYGMGSRKLSAELGISTAEAKEIIENYFKAFPTVKEYIESVKNMVKERGYIETILKRRRFFDYESANSMAKSAILREAVNSIFQGSAADLIKLSMLKIDKEIKGRNLDAKLLLQIHDELIFEIKEDIAKELSIEFSSLMEGIYKLNLPLKTSVAVGSSWDELK